MVKVIVVLVTLNVVVLETPVKLELDVGADVEFDDAKVNVEVEDVVEETELEESIPLQKPFTQVLKAHCESDEQVAWKLPHLGISIEFTA